MWRGREDKEGCGGEECSNGVGEMKHTATPTIGEWSMEDKHHR